MLIMHPESLIWHVSDKTKVGLFVQNIHEHDQGYGTLVLYIQNLRPILVDGFYPAALAAVLAVRCADDRHLDSSQSVDETVD